MFANNTAVVCPYVDVVQTRVRQHHRRRLSAVHIAGSFMMTWVQTEPGRSSQRQHSSNVVMLALLVPRVLRSSGVLALNAGCTTITIRQVDVKAFAKMVLHCLKLPDSVNQTQVRDCHHHLSYKLDQIKYAFV